jgi:hypothetical protein
MQSTVVCFPSSGYFVFEWSKRWLTASGETLFHPPVL